jgi:uncharacterized protein YraI
MEDVKMNINMKQKWQKPVGLVMTALLALLIFAVPGAAWAQEETTQNPFSPAVVTAETTVNLHIRQGPGLQYQSLAVLPAGTMVGFTGYTDATREWVQVDAAGGPVGWVAARFLSHRPEALQVLPAEAVAEAPGPGVIGIGAETAATRVNLNVRQGPGIQFAIIDTLPRGVAVGFTGVTDPTGAWVEVTSDAAPTGWVAAAFLSQTPPDLQVRTVARPPTVFSPAVVTAVTQANLNLREGPGIEHEILATLPRGAVVGFTGFSDATGQWVQVDAADGPIGWVAARFLSHVPAGLQTWSAEQ